MWDAGVGEAQAGNQDCQDKYQMTPPLWQKAKN